MRTLLLGRCGQIGWELERCLGVLGDVVAVDRSGLDLRRAADIRRIVESAAPAVIVNAAAYTDVEGAEAEPDTAHAMNATAVEVLAQEAGRRGAVLVQYSTDYIFDGRKAVPYGEDDAAAPLNAYGRSKWAGEEAIRASGAAHLILRTSWVYAARGRNLLRKILHQAGVRDRLQVVNTQVGAPTWARFVAEATCAMLWRMRLDAVARDRVARGEVVNVANGGAATWHEFAAEAVAQYAERVSMRAPGVDAVASYPMRAARPANSRLDLTRLERDWGITPPPWRQSLALCIDELAAQANAAGERPGVALS